MKPTILNAQGQPIILNEMEARVAEMNQRHVNALGYEIDITTLTTIIKKVSEQKFFQIAPADYVPVKVGEGAWSSNLVTYRSFNLADDFSTGVINTGNNGSRLAAGDAAVDSVPVRVLNWAKEITWTIFDLQQASKSGNWDIVTAKEKARKKNWDLGIQKVAFLGLSGDSSCLGLYNQAGITTDTTTLTGPISGLSPANLSTFIAAVLNVYRANNQRTAWPTHFIIPESDYLGLATPSSSDFPIKSKLELMQETFQIMTGNKQFKVLPSAFGDNAYSGLGVQKYVLLNYDEESIRMDVPVDYTNTLANSVNNFSFQNVGYGQFTGVMAYRDRELYYFQY
jgi:hypothetical protein